MNHEKPRILVAGASGFVGTPAVAMLQDQGFTVRRLVRDRERRDETSVFWDPERGDLDRDAVEWADVIINFSGHNISGGRWSPRVKALLKSSRLQSTALLVDAMLRASHPPSTLINASAVGYYGNRGDEILDEQSPPGSDFLADLSRSWETAADQATHHGVRVVLLRFGIVVGAGGALAKMLPIFRLGLGGPIGTGAQWWSWIAIDDVLGVIRHALADEDYRGPINVVAPEAATCLEFSRTLGRVLGRPALLPAPKFAVRLALGEMADALLLASTRVRPARLEDLGYQFVVPHLEDALRRAIS